MRDGGYYDPYVHCAAAAAEERSFWSRGRNALIVWALRKYFPDAGSLIEVGCGTGIVLGAVQQALPRLELVGVEPFRPALDEARRRLGGVELLERDARQLSFPDRFDVVASLDVLEHVDDDRAVLAEMYRTARPGGGVLVTVPQHAWLWSAADDWALHHRRYARGDLLTKLRAAGFDVVRATSFVSLPLPLMVLARSRSRARKEYDPMAEFALPRLIDSALGAMLALERVGISLGLSYPFGGSLLVVASKPRPGR